MAASVVDSGDGFEIRRNNLGWGGVVKLTRRPFAVLIRGEFLVDRADRIRTYGSRGAAQQVIDEGAYLAGLAPGGGTAEV